MIHTWFSNTDSPEDWAKSLNENFSEIEKKMTHDPILMPLVRPSEYLILDHFTPYSDPWAMLIEFYIYQFPWAADNEVDTVLEIRNSNFHVDISNGINKFILNPFSDDKKSGLNFPSGVINGIKNTLFIQHAGSNFMEFSMNFKDFRRMKFPGTVSLHEGDSVKITAGGGVTIAVQNFCIFKKSLKEQEVLSLSFTEYDEWRESLDDKILCSYEGRKSNFKTSHTPFTWGAHHGKYPDIVLGTLDNKPRSSHNSPSLIKLGW